MLESGWPFAFYSPPFIPLPLNAKPFRISKVVGTEASGAVNDAIYFSRAFSPLSKISSQNQNPPMFIEVLALFGGQMPRLMTPFFTHFEA